jgi:Na+(H+)/acetate symporter ActP
VMPVFVLLLGPAGFEEWTTRFWPRSLVERPHSSFWRVGWVTAWAMTVAAVGAFAVFVVVTNPS